MKKRSKLLCLLLALVLMVSMFPLQAAAEDTTEEEEAKPATGTVTVKVVVGKTTLYTYKVEVGDKAVTLSDSKYIKHKEKYYEYSYYTVSGAKKASVTIPAFDSAGAEAWQKKWGDTIKVVYKSHKHSYHFGFGRIYHWNICACGDTTKEVRHVDPAKDADKVCTCGYKFSDNTDLTTLWLSGMVLSPKFNKDTTEYIGEIHTYQDVTSTTITAKPFDALAKVELPENLEIHEGANKFEIHITAEDKTATKTYTVIAVKPVKVEDTFVSTDGTTVSAKLKTKIAKKIASASISEAVAEKLLEYAVQDKAGAISLIPEFSKWSVNQAEICLSGDFVKAIAEKTEANLTVQTPYESTLTIPHDQLVELAEKDVAVTIRIGKDNTFDILTVEQPITASRDITLTVPEK